MSEVRPGDVLRLFFGGTPKHYLVVKIGKDTIDLRHESGSDTLLHQEGRLVSVGKTAVTGFVVLRDPTLYQEFASGLFVEVVLHGGGVFKGTILENDDGILKLRAPTGQTVYVDLSNSDGPVRKVALSETLDDSDSPSTADLPLDLPELQLRAVELAAAGSTAAWRCMSRRPAPPSPLLPRWILPVLDNERVERHFLRGSEGWKSPAATFKGGEKSRETTTAATLEGAGFKHGVSVLFYRFEQDEPMPVARLAAAPELLPLSRAFQRGTSLYDRIRYHGSLKLLFRAWRAHAVKARKFACLSDVFAAVPPPAAPTATSLHALLKALEPYPKPSLASELWSAGVQLKLPEKVDEVSMPARQPQQTRHFFGKDYGGFVPTELFTTEVLAQVLALDQGRRYLHAAEGSVASLFDLFRAKQGAVWRRERNWQALRKSPTPVVPYDRAYLGVLNTVYDGLSYSSDRVAASDACITEHARAAKAGESPAWLYHIVTGEKLVPSAVERVLRAHLVRGQSGLAAAVKALSLVAVEGSLVDAATGVVVSQCAALPEPDNGSVPIESEPVQDTASLVDLTLGRLLEKLELRLGVTLVAEQKAQLFSRVRWRAYDFTDAGIALAGYVAHWGKKSAGEAANALRDLVHRSTDLRDFHSLVNMSDLSTRVSLAAERAALNHPLPKPEEKMPPGDSATRMPCPDQVPRMQWVEKIPPSVTAVRRPPAPLDPPPPPKYSFDVPRDEVERRARQHDAWHQRTKSLEGDPSMLVELVRNLCIIAPSFLAHRDKRPPLGHALPPGKRHPEALRRWTKSYCDPWKELAASDDASAARFVAVCRSHAMALKMIYSTAVAAERARDTEALRFCVVNAVHLFKQNAAPGDDPYVVKFLETVFALSIPK